MKQALFSLFYLSSIILFGQDVNSTYRIKSYTTNDTLNIEIKEDTLSVFNHNVNRQNKKFEFNINITFSNIKEYYIPQKYNHQIKEIDNKNDIVFEIGYKSKIVDNKQIWIQEIGRKRKNDSITTNFPTVTYESFFLHYT
jgi:hypothetical protein